MGDPKKTGGESALERGLTLGDFSFEPLAGLISGPAGRVKVDPKVMDVLNFLARRAGEVVPRQELLDEIWPGVIVSDDALSRCIYQLRRGLSQAGGSARYKTLLETLPKRGYRLHRAVPNPVSGTVNEPTSAVHRQARAGLLRLASSSLVGLAAGVSTVVFLATMIWRAESLRPRELPTANARAYDAYVRANDYFGRSDSRTALPYAVRLYEEAVELDPTFAAALLGLAQAHTDMYWHGIDATRWRLEQAEVTIDRLSALGSDSPEARLARANYLLKGLNRYEAALTELAEAEKSNPHDPQLYFLRAMALRRLGDWGRSISALDQALALDSRNILYLRQQFVSYQFIRDYERAGQILDRVLELYPDDGTAYVDQVMLALCRDGDISMARRFEEAPPSASYDDGLAYTYTAWLAAILGRDYDRALRILNDSVEDPIFDGDFRNASFGPRALFYARTHRLTGDDEMARAEYSAVIRLVEERPPGVTGAESSTAAGRYLALAEAQAALGLRDEALDSLRHLRELFPASEDALMSSAVQIASVVRVLVPAGFEDEALRELDDYLGKDVGYWSIEGLRADPRLEPIRSDERFQALVEKY